MEHDAKAKNNHKKKRKEKKDADNTRTSKSTSPPCEQCFDAIARTERKEEGG